MNTYSLSHLSDSTLLRDLAALVAQDRATTAHLLAHIAEVDARQLYLPAAYPSMFAYCLGELHLSEEVAFKRIHAARAARRCPALFAAVADGRLHLSGVVLLAPWLTPQNAVELLTATAHKTKFEIEQVLAQRFPRPDPPTWIEALSPPPSPPHSDNQHAPGRVEPPSTGAVEDQLAGQGPAQHCPGSVGDRPRVKPLAPERYALQVSIGQATHDKLRYAQALLGHQIAPSDVAGVLDRALDALIHRLEKRKFGATSRPRRGLGQRAAKGRHVPAEIRRTVWERDGGRCTFVSEAGRRCPARTRLEFDHIQEVARGGEATVAGIRLRCRAHNQYQAEQAFGTEFMRHKRQEAKRRATETQTRRAAVVTPGPERDVAPWLRHLGFRADEVRRAAALCEAIPEASLEERVRLALSSLARSGPRRLVPGVGSRT